MSFLSGRVSFARFKITGRSTRMFGPEHLEKLAEHAIGKQKVASAGGVESGWTAGDHILDTQFDLAKNVVNDTLQFALRLDTQKVPADLLRAYTHVELQGLAAGNPSGMPSARQRREARARAQERLDQESRDGRYLRRKAYPILWDCQAQELFIAAGAESVFEEFYPLFQKTFNHRLESVGAGHRAFLLAEAHEQTRGVDDARPSPFTSASAQGEVAWLPDEANRDFLGNEFLLWLWYVLEVEQGTLALSDHSEAAVMLARSLVLECPRGETGRETIQSTNPSRLPEAKRAVQSGKLPRKAGMVLARHDREYEFTLSAESLAVSGAKLPPPEADDERARAEERVTIFREMVQSLDLLYEVFARLRTGSNWPKELAKIKKWLAG